jgi:hypothetical protein
MLFQEPLNVFGGGIIKVTTQKTLPSSKLAKLLLITFKLQKLISEASDFSVTDCILDREMARLNSRLERLIEICQNQNLLAVGKEVCVFLEGHEVFLRLTAHSLDLRFDPAIAEFVEVLAKPHLR